MYKYYLIGFLAKCAEEGVDLDELPLGKWQTVGTGPGAPPPPAPVGANSTAYQAPPGGDGESPTRNVYAPSTTKRIPMRPDWQPVATGPGYVKREGGTGTESRALRQKVDENEPPPAASRPPSFFVGNQRT